MYKKYYCSGEGAGDYRVTLYKVKFLFLKKKTKKENPIQREKGDGLFFSAEAI